MNRRFGNGRSEPPRDLVIHNRRTRIEKGVSMKYMKYAALLAVLLVPLTYSHAEVRFGIGVGPGYVAGPPGCPYGYYPDYPYACAPYGYYGPTWFSSGVFIGAGPWYHGWGRPVYPRPFYGRIYAPAPYFRGGSAFYNHDRDYDRDRYGRGFEDRRFEDRGRRDHDDHGFRGRR